MKNEDDAILFEVLSALVASLAEDGKGDMSALVISLRGIDSRAYFPCSDENKLDQLAKLEELEKLYIELSKRLYMHGGVKWFKGREDLAFSFEDFEGTPRNAEFSLCVFQVLLQNVHASHGGRNFPDVYKRVMQTFCICSILLIAEHWDEDFMWSDAATKQAAVKTQECVEEVCSGTLEEILTHPREASLFSSGLLVPILTEIKPRLSKESWKQNPSLKHMFFWMLTNVKSPYVGEHLDLLFPPPLMFLDHHQVDNKVTGVKCLKHILTETSSSEIQWYGRADVIYQALQHQLYQHEPQLLQEVMPCLLTVLKITEFSKSLGRNTPQEEDRFDEIVPHILSDMETETRILVRHEYTKHLRSYIDTLGIRNVKYYKRLLRVISSYLEIYDGPDEVARLNILDALELVIKVTWPRVPNHSLDICKVLVKLMWDISTDTSSTPDSVKDTVFCKAESCLIWLSRAAQTHTNELINSILKIDTMPSQVRSCLHQIITNKIDTYAVLAS